MNAGLRKELRETEDEAYELRDALHAARMTLRDTFAAAALTGMLTDQSRARFNADTMATDAYRLADAMLKARETK